MTKDKESEIIVAEPQDEATLALERAATLMAKAASDRKNRDTILKEAEAVLAKVPMGLVPELAESPVVQALLNAIGINDLKPGEIKNKGTLAEREREWTLNEINREVREGRMPLKRFVPAETLPLTFNGVQIYVKAGDECEVPECFYNIYKERQNALRQGRIHEQYLLGKSDTPPDPNWMTEEAATVRAWSTQGRPFGKVSGHIGVGPIDMGEEASA